MIKNVKVNTNVFHFGVTLFTQHLKAKQNITNKNRMGIPVDSHFGPTTYIRVRSF